MITFDYKAIQRDGQTVTGEIQAKSRAEALARLDRDKLQPVVLKAKSGAATEKGAAPKAATVLSSDGTLTLSRKQIFQFTDELGDLLEAGLRLEPALAVMEKRQESSSLKVLAGSLRAQIRDGVSLSAALRRISKSFGELYCSMITAGEMSGAMVEIVRRQAHYLQAIGELQGRVLSALIYPAFLLGVGIILIMVFMTVLVPKLTALLTKSKGTMPLATKLLIGASQFCSSYWWLMLAVGIIVGILFYSTIRQPAGRRWWDEAQLKIPLVGPIMTAGFLAQFSQTMATLLVNGVPLVNALRLMTASTQNVYLKLQMDRLTQEVSDGAVFSRSLQRLGAFPPVFCDMVTVGEQTGDLGTSLEKIGKRYDKELTSRIERLTGMIQPVLIIVMAALVAVVAYALVSGISSTVSGLNKRH
jgi:type II secretory pathway component PulF